MSYDALTAELRSLELLYWFGKLAPRDVNLSAVAGAIDATGRLGKVDAPMITTYARRTHLPALREVVFVRAISALEVFLVDSLKTLFLERPDLFHVKGEVVEFQTSEVLSSSSIAPLKAKILDCLSRRLQNQGFEEVVKYYRKFGVLFEQSGVSPQSLSEVHERRHLLVHRLGKTDAIYRHKHNVTMARVTVDEAYLLESLTAVRELCRFVNGRLRRVAQDKRTPDYDPRGLRVRVELAAITPRVATFLDPDRCAVRRAADDSRTRHSRLRGRGREGEDTRFGWSREDRPSPAARPAEAGAKRARSAPIQGRLESSSRLPIDRWSGAPRLQHAPALATSEGHSQGHCEEARATQR